MTAHVINNRCRLMNGQNWTIQYYFIKWNTFRLYTFIKYNYWLKIIYFYLDYLQFIHLYFLSSIFIQKYRCANFLFQFVWQIQCLFGNPGFLRDSRTNLLGTFVYSIPLTFCIRFNFCCDVKFTMSVSSFRNLTDKFLFL